jgi:2-methylisocitrate lyase-like PEP mutase family enzyme
MDHSELRARAEALLRLHDRTRVLVLPNAWDVASARAIEEAGFPAIATTSAGIAAVLGYPDGQNVSRDEMLEMVARIARKLRVPLTADLEAGYGDAGETVRRALQAGAVGMNLEDAKHGGGLVPMAEHVEQVQKARAAAKDVHFVINARCDAFFTKIDGDPFDTAIQRGRAYLAAGADCIFYPGLRDVELIGRIVKILNAPVNLLAGPGTPPIAKLAELGVARVSAGSGTMRAALTAGLRAAEELRDHGTYRYAENILTHAQVNALLGKS